MVVECLSSAVCFIYWGRHSLAGNDLLIGDGGKFEKRQLNICTNVQ